jgi:tRNA(Ile)-lysidine synthase
VHPLVSKVKKSIIKYSLISPGDRVLVAFSGGPDSTALSQILLFLQDIIGFNIALFHLNHGLRGKEAERDEDFCISWAKNRKVPIFVERENVKNKKVTEHLSLEEAARVVRYQVMRKVADSWGAEKIALGHTMNDQGETVLLNIFRGTGLEGLQGMKFKEDRFIRPLLGVQKGEILAFLEEEGIPFVEDSSNQDMSFLRNRLRNLIPLLEKEFNSHLVEALFRLSLNVQEGEVSELKPGIPIEKKGILKKAPLSYFKGFSSSDLLKIIRFFVKETRGNLWDISREHTEEVARLLDKGGGEVHLPGKVKVFIRDGYLWISPNSFYLTDVPPWSFALQLPGENFFPDLGIAIKGNWKGEEKKKMFPSIEWDFDKCCPPFQVRNFRDGDRVWQKGKEVKVKELFSQKGIGREWRRLIPLICYREKILWIPDLALDERIIVRENSRQILVVSVNWL